MVKSKSARREILAGRRSAAGNGHGLYQDRAGADVAARIDVVADRRQPAEHDFKAAGDGDLLDLTWDQGFNSRAEARGPIFEWIEMFYNRERLHETLDDVSPVRYEAQSIDF